MRHVLRMLAVLTIASPALASGVDWAESWADAQAEARARNCPIFITFHQDH